MHQRENLLCIQILFVNFAKKCAYRGFTLDILRRIVLFTKHSAMTIWRKIILVIFLLLWLGLSWIMLDRAGITLYNILVALLAGGLIFVPIFKKWNK
jgi:hypothetical protein